MAEPEPTPEQVIEDRTEWLAEMIQGAFTVAEGGVYQFRLEADDGALLFIDGEFVVDNDGIHGAISKRGRVELREGRHRIVCATSRA